LDKPGTSGELSRRSLEKEAQNPLVAWVLRSPDEKTAAEVFQRYRLGSTGFWQSVAVPPDVETRPAVKLRNALEELGGVYMIFARFLLWRSDLLSFEYLEQLREIDYDLPPTPRAEVIGLLLRELGPLSDELIAQMEPEPVWSTLTRTGYVSWYEGRAVVVQVGREPIPETHLAAFEAGIVHLGQADLCHLSTPRVLAEFREWIRQAESIALERSYLEVLSKNRGETLVDYPVLIEEITTDAFLCWPWVDGETVESMIRRGASDALIQAAVAVFEEFFALSIIDADIDTTSMVLAPNSNRLAVRRLNRPLAVPPPAVNLGMKYVAAVLEGNASLTVQTLLTLALGRSLADIESEFLNLISAVEPELKVRRWFPGSAASFESNWRALARLDVTRPRPLFLDCIQRNLIAVGYWTSDAVANGGEHVDTIADAHWPVVSSLVRANASQLLDSNAVKEWSMGMGLLTFGAMREANRLAEEFREADFTLEVEMPEALPQIRRQQVNERSRRLPLIVTVLLIVLLACLHWGSTMHGLAAATMLALAVLALLGLFLTIGKIG
jgi:hypothetical protein